MTTKTSAQPSLNASYVLNPANGEIKLVMAAKKGLEKKATSGPEYVKTHYAIDSNGGGYTGL